MTVFSFLCAAFVSAAGLLGSVLPLQMLQQNSYVNSRYADWLSERFSFKNICFKLLFALLFTAATLVNVKTERAVSTAVGVLLSLLCLGAAVKAFLGSRSVQKKSIKPLVFTMRVKRMMITHGAVSAVFFGLCFVKNIGLYMSFVCCLLFLCRELVVALVNIINRPIERAVSNHYINDAKKILGSIPNLLTVGVTGSYGKTTSKFILARILSEKYTVTVTPESFNTPMGIVHTVREKMTPGTEIFIAEMGAKNVGDIKEICDIVHPDMGLITSVGPQHLNTFGSIENIINTKFELADAVSQKNGKMFLNGDNEYIKERAKAYNNTCLYGTDGGLDVYAENVVCSSSGSSFDIVFPDRRIPVSTRLLGSHNVQNITGAAALASELCVEDSDIRFAVSSLKPTPHRLEMKSFINGAVLIDDAYNSNPSGCLEAVRVLSHFDGMKKIIVTPGLVELGEKEYECNFALGDAAGKVCDEIYLVGKMRSKPMTDALEKQGFDKNRVFVVSSFKEAMAKLAPTLDKNCAVLLENDLPDNYLK